MCQRQRSRGTIAIASYNIQDGRKGGVNSAVCAFKKERINVAILQETKIAQARFAPRAYRGYTIRVSPSIGKHCGGVGLVYHRNKRFTVENAKVVGPNVILFEMVFHELERW